MCSVPMKSCLSARASSCAKITTWRALSVNRSNIVSLRVSSLLGAASSVGVVNRVLQVNDRV